MGFHNWSNLCRQRAQQLTRLLLFARINHGERGNKINMGIRVRFIFVEPQVDHMFGVDQDALKGCALRLVKDSVEDSVAGAKQLERNRDPTVAEPTHVVPYILSNRSHPVLTQPSHHHFRPQRPSPTVYNLARSCPVENGKPTR